MCCVCRQKNFERALLVLLALVAAVVGGSSLDNFVSLIGAVACVPLAFIFPAMMHFKAFPDQSWLRRWSDVFFTVFGCGVLVFATYVCLSTWGGAAEKSPCRKSSVVGNVTMAFFDEL